MKKFLLSAVKKLARALPIAMLFSVAMQASAATITYIQTGHGSGTLDGVAFDSDFAVTAIGDTDNVTSCGAPCLYNDNLSATIFIEYLGVFNFITPTRYFAAGDTIGLSRAGSGGLDLFYGPALSGWDMVSTTGAV